MLRLPASCLPTLALAALLTQHGLAVAQPLAPPTRNSPAVVAAFKSVVEKPSESTVRVLSDGEQIALGTIISDDGYILTKASELRSPLACRLKDGRTFTARIVGVEDNFDLAVLKIGASRLRPIEWRAAKTAEVGQWVTAPAPDSEPVAIGVVSVGMRTPSQRELLQPRTMARKESGYLGVRLGEEEDGSPSIVEVTEGSPAEEFGLKAKDIVLAVDGRVVRTRDRLIAMIQTLRPGQEVKVKVRRGEAKTEEVKVKLARFPQDMFDRSARMNMMGSELSHRLGGFPVILQHDLLIKPRDCGGPLVDLDGKAMGLNIARAGRTESYAVPWESIEKLLPKLKSGEMAPADDSDESRVAHLEATVQKLQGELTRMEGAAKELTGDNAAEAKRLAATLRKRLDKAKQELAKARQEQARK